MIQKSIGIGMLGYAFMGKAHSSAYVKTSLFFGPPRPNLVALYGRNQQKVKGQADKLGFSRYYDDWRKLIHDGDIDVVDNVLPNDMHEAPCIEAAEEGKNVLCEKPLGRGAEESERMLRAASKAHIKHMVGYNYRFVPAILLSRKMIKDGEIGKPLEFRATYLQDWAMSPDLPLLWRFSKERAGTGALGDLGSHIIDLSRFLVGDIKSTSALTKTFQRKRPIPGNPKRNGTVNVDDAFLALLKFKNGAVGSVEASRFCAGRKNFARIEIHGSEGSLYFDLERLNELKYYSRRGPQEEQGFKSILVTDVKHPFIRNWWPPGHVLGWEHAMINQIHHFIEAIAKDEKVEPWGATFLDGVKVDLVLDAISKASKSERWEQIG